MLKVPDIKNFTLLDWGIHFGVIMNLIVVVLLVWYSLTH